MKNFKLEKKINILIFFVCCLPLSLVIGAFVMEVFVFFSCLTFFIINLQNNKSLQYYKTNFFYIFLSFNILILISSILSDYKINSLKSTLFYFRFGILVLIILFLLEESKKFAKYFFYSILFTFSLLLLVGLRDIYLTLKEFALPPIHGVGRDYRISSIFGQEQIMGSYLVRLYPILLGLYFQFKSSRFINSIFFIFVTMIFFLILNSGERAAIFLMIMSFIILIIFFPLKTYYKIFFSFLFIFFLFLSISLNPHLKQRIFVNTKQLLLENNKLNIFSRGHQEHFTSAIKIFKENKLIGVGVKNFRLECRKDSFKDIGINACTTHPHNTYIQLLAETGILGFFYGLFILIYTLKFFFNKFKDLIFIKDKKNLNFPAICFGTSIIINIFPFITTGSLFNNWISTVYFLPLGFFFYSIKK